MHKIFTLLLFQIKFANKSYIIFLFYFIFSVLIAAIIDYNLINEKKSMIKENSIDDKIDIIADIEVKIINSHLLVKYHQIVEDYFFDTIYSSSLKSYLNPERPLEGREIRVKNSPLTHNEIIMHIEVFTTFKDKDFYQIVFDELQAIGFETLIPLLHKKIIIDFKNFQIDQNEYVGKTIDIERFDFENSNLFEVEVVYDLVKVWPVFYDPPSFFIKNMVRFPAFTALIIFLNFIGLLVIGLFPRNDSN